MATRMLAPAAVLLIVFGLEVAAECDSSQCCCLAGDIQLTQTGRSVLLTGPVGSAENCFGQTQTSMPCDIISPENSSCVGLQGLFTLAKVSNGITVTMPCHSSTRSTAEFRCADGECGTTGWNGTHRRTSSEPATTADTSTTEIPNADSCEAIRCSDRCLGPCGWSTQRMLCLFGAITNPVTEVGLGDCTGESVLLLSRSHSTYSLFSTPHTEHVRNDVVDKFNCGSDTAHHRCSFLGLIHPSLQSSQLRRRSLTPRQPRPPSPRSRPPRSAHPSQQQVHPVTRLFVWLT